MDLQARLSAALGSRYAIEEEIGRGGMAVVFRAHDRKHDRRVAVKVFRPELSAALGSERFLHEIQVTAQLQHPHIVPLHDSGAAAGLLFYIMPHVVGETLRGRLARETQLPVDEALAIAHNVADALSHAHSLGVVHRDIKPENILLSGGHAVVADFGVAGAISAAAHPGRLTQPHLALGTAAYMSPEQAAGTETIDGRSDLYSLGCVLYEMLAGEAPFSAATARAMAARNLGQSPLHVVRSSVSSELERVVEKALAELPADRFRTADDMISALRAATREADVPSVSTRRRPRLGVAAVAMSAAAALLFVVSRSSTSVPLDDSLYVVFPFEHRVTAAPGLVNGDQCELEITNVLRSFEDARTVEHFLVADAIRRRGDGVLSSDDAIAIARDLGGRWLVRGEIVHLSDSALVRATLFDAQSGRVRGHATIGLPEDGRKLPERFRYLVADLLDLPAIATATGSAHSLTANRRFVEGRRALAGGDLTRAAAGFREAAALDTSFAAAYLWAAQVNAWRNEPPAEWRGAARQARDLLRPDEGGREPRLASGLVALADGRFQEACGEYRTLVARDSTDWMAWVGLGECQVRDTIVVRDSLSPSGWSFRGSRQAGIEAYRRALGLTAFLTPVLYERLAAVVPAEIRRVRRGVPARPDTGVFLSHPGFAGDTFAYVPYPAAAIQRGIADDTTAGTAAARGRELLRDLVAQWAAAYPGSAAAQAMLAETLERFGQIGPGGRGTPSALDAIRTARRLATDATAVARYTAIEARLALKRGDVARAVALADSLLDRWPDPPPELAERVAAMAALTGRAGRAAAALANNAVTIRDDSRDPTVRALPIPIFDARERARAYAALGAPRDSLERWLREVDRRLSGAMGTLGRDEVRAALLTNPLMWAFPTLGASALHRPDAPEYLLGMQALAARGAAAALRARFDSLAMIRRDVPAGAVSLGAVFQESHLLLGMGDTAAATSRLATALDALPVSGSELTGDVVEAAAVVRAMALLAQLALAAHDTTTAVRWARPVTVLWARADAAVRSTVEDLFSLAAR